MCEAGPGSGRSISHASAPLQPRLTSTICVARRSPSSPPSFTGGWDAQLRVAQEHDEAGKGDGGEKKRVLVERGEAKAKGGESCSTSAR